MAVGDCEHGNRMKRDVGHCGDFRFSSQAALGGFALATVLYLRVDSPFRLSR